MRCAWRTFGDLLECRRALRQFSLGAKNVLADPGNLFGVGLHGIVQRDDAGLISRLPQFVFSLGQAGAQLIRLLRQEVAHDPDRLMDGVTKGYTSANRNSYRRFS